MNTSWRAKRKAELQDLRFTDPVRLIVLYRMLTGLDDLEPLPARASYASIIQSILEHEILGRDGKQRCQQISKVNPTRPTFTLNDPTITLIEHLRSSPASHVDPGKPSMPANASIADEVFGPIDIYDESIDWNAAARFARQATAWQQSRAQSGKSWKG